MKTKLLTIYGARYSNSNERINISLCCGEGAVREWYTLSLPLRKVRINDETNTIDVIDIKLLTNDTKAVQ